MAFCFPSRHPSFAVRLSKVYFSGFQFQNSRYNKSLENREGYLNLISLFNLHPRTKNYAGVFLARVLLLKHPVFSKAAGHFGLFRNGTTAEKAEGITRTWKVFLVILALFLSCFENIHISPI